MKSSKTIFVVVAAVVLAAVMFGGGYLVATKVTGSSSSIADVRSGPNGGAFAQLTEAERQQLQNMTAEERQQFFEEKGITLPQGADGSNMPSGTPGGGMGGGSSVLEGTVASVASDTITVALSSGGSAVVYIDGNTVKAAVSGAKPDIVQGAKVLVYAEPEATGVTAAKAIIVK